MPLFYEKWVRRCNKTPVIINIARAAIIIIVIQKKLICRGGRLLKKAKIRNTANFYSRAVMICHPGNNKGGNQPIKGGWPVDSSTENHKGPFGSTWRLPWAIIDIGTCTKVLLTRPITTSVFPHIPA